MTTNKLRYLARIIIQAETPLAVGSGERNALTDQMVATDVNGLPYIPGTTLAGVLRHALEENIDQSVVNQIMGFQGERNANGNDDGQGSRLILSHAQMIGKEKISNEGITMINDQFYKPFLNLPVRQHVRISHRGAAEDKGKFDEQVAYKGTRFCFEMELVSNETAEKEIWNKMLKLFNSPVFRIGGGTRKGFGELSVVECKATTLNLTNVEHLNLYLNKTSNLNDEFWNGDDKKVVIDQEVSNSKTYKLNLEPDNFFLFSSGLESVDAKMIPVTEQVIVWNTPNSPEFLKEQLLIPATSVKGALAHRTAFHYNKLVGNTAEKIKDLADKEGLTFDKKARQLTGENNPAVRALFGYSAKGNEGKRGNMIISDLLKGESNSANKKILNHVAIDRFTGGAMDGALFSEQVVYGKEEIYTLKIYVNQNGLDPIYIDAFEKSLNDLASGMLPLGGGTMRGHGCFTDKNFKIGKELKNAN